MKTRLISALIAMLIFIPILFIGGTLFNVAVYIISVLGLYEFIKIKEEKKELPSFIKFIRAQPMCRLTSSKTSTTFSITCIHTIRLTLKFTTTVLALIQTKSIFIFIICCM